MLIKKLSWMMLFLLFVSTFSISCTKRRSDQFAQGQGMNNLQKVSDFDGKIFEICTKDIEDGLANSSVGNKTNIAQDLESINNFNLIKYTTDSELMPQELPFRGPVNTCYDLVYKITDNYLKLYKVGKRESIPFQERSSAEKREDGRLAVPILGYPLEHYRVEKRLNRDNEATHEFIELRVQHKEEGGYFRFSRSRYELFSTIEKIDTFPVPYFEFDDVKSEWYYAATLVSGGGDLDTYSGLWSSSDSEGNITSKVRFCRVNEGLVKVVNASIDRRYKRDKEAYESCLHTPEVLRIKVKHLDFRAHPQGDDTSLSEEIYTTKHWKERKLIQFIFDSIVAAGGTNGSLDAIDFQKNYFSFTIAFQSGAERGKIKFSFKRIVDKNNYKPRYFFKKDTKHFALLSRDLNIKSGPENDNYSREQKNKVVLRFNPQKVAKNGIHYRLEKNSIEKYNEIAQKAVDIVDWSFKQAGLNIPVILDKEKTSFGDIRYNVIRFSKSVQGGFYNGVSQVIADSDTGEIVSSSALIDVSAIKRVTQEGILKYIYSELGVTSGELFRTSFFDNYQSTDSKHSGLKSTYLHPLLGSENDKIMFKIPFYYSSEDNPNQLLQNNINVYEENKNNSRKLSPVNSQQSNFSSIKCSSDNDSFSLIGRMKQLTNNKCAPLMNHIEFLKNNGVVREAYRQLDYELISICAETLMEDKLISVAVHELLHSVGIDHNFRGSTDKKNFYQVNELLKRVENDPRLNFIEERLKQFSGSDYYSESSSIMDYLQFNDKMLLMPGKFDIAMIKLLYKDQATLINGQFKTVHNGEPIVDQAKNLHPFYFCNDEDFNVHLDSLCLRHDRGTTPLEITQDIISRYEESLSRGHQRFYLGQQLSPARVQLFNLFQYFLPLKRIYDQYRLKLLQFTKPQNKYLTQFNYPFEFEEMLKNLGLNRNASLRGKNNLSKILYPEMQQFIDAAENVKDFFKNRLMLLPNRYCRYRNSKVGTEGLIELDIIRDHMGSNERITSCDDINVQKYLDQFYQSNLVPGEIGSSLYTSQASRGEKDWVYDAFDSIGTLGDRFNAMLMMTGRFPLGPEYQQKRFYPSMMDEVEFRKDLLTKMQDRVFNGVTISGVGHSYLNFAQEQNLLQTMFSIYKYGLNIPGQRDVVNKRLTPFQVMTLPKAMSSNSISSIDYGAISYSSAHLDNTFTIDLITEIKRLEIILNDRQHYKSLLTPEHNKLIVDLVEAMPIDQRSLDPQAKNSGVLVGQFIKWMKFMRKVILDHQEENPIFVNHLENIFSVEIYSLNEMIQSQLVQKNEKFQQNNYNNIDVEALMDRVSDDFKKQPLERVSHYSLNRRFNKNSSERIFKYFSRVNNASMNILFAPDEVVAQKELLISILTH